MDDDIKPYHAYFDESSKAREMLRRNRSFTKFVDIDMTRKVFLGLSLDLPKVETFINKFEQQHTEYLN